MANTNERLRRGEINRVEAQSLLAEEQRQTAEYYAKLEPWRAELAAWRELGADITTALKAQIEQRVSVMATESRSIDLQRERAAAFATILARIEMLTMMAPK